MIGWYKQQRNLSERAWFKDALMVQLYAYLKERAYVTDGRHEGYVIRRGSCPITRSEMSEVTGMSARTLDRVLKKLVSYGEIIVKGNNRFSIITVCDYDGCATSDSLFGTAYGTTDGIAGGTTDGIAGGITHLSTIEYKKEEYKKNLITPYSPYKNERESEDVAFEAKRRYNSIFDGKLPPLIRLTMPTKMMVEECVRRFGRQAIDLVFEEVLATPFALGVNKTGFRANFQFIFKPNNFQQYLESAQLRRSKQKPTASGDSVDGASDKPQPTEEDKMEQRRQQLLGCVRLVEENPASLSRNMLVGAYHSGELAELGIEWKP